MKTEREQLQIDHKTIDVELCNMCKGFGKVPDDSQRVDDDGTHNLICGRCGGNGRMLRITKIHYLKFNDSFLQPT
jgi:hypothetical protein